MKIKGRRNRARPTFITAIFFSLLLCYCAWGAPDDGDAGWAPIISVRAAPDETLYVAAAEKGGVYSSTNGGRSWRHIGGTLAPDNLYSLRVSAGGDVFLATFGEVLCSSNEGVSWSSIKGDGFIKDLFPARSGALLATNWRGGFSFASAETGNWKSVGNDAFLITDFVESKDKRLWCGAFGGGVLVSYDGGISWDSYGGGPENGMVLSLALSDQDKVLYAGTYEGGVFMRREDRPWLNVSEGLPPGSTVQALAVAKDGALWAGTCGDGCFVLKRGGQNWEILAEGGGKGVSVTAIEPFRDGVVFGTESGGLYYAEAGRSSFRPLQPFDPVAGLAELENGAVAALSRSGRLYRSGDGGHSWQTGGEIPVSGGACTVLIVTPEGALLAGGPGCVYRSDGEVWTRCALPGAPGSAEVTALARSDGVIFAATWRDGVFRSRDGGKTWARADTTGVYVDEEGRPPAGDEGAYIYGLVADGPNAAMATDYGFSVSVDGGETWRHSFVNYGLFSIVFDQDGTIVGSSKTGLWRCTPESMEIGEVRAGGALSSRFSYFTGLFSGRDGLLFGETDGGLHRLIPRNGGYVAEGASLKNVGAAVMLSLSDGKILTGTTKALYRSDDGGVTWKEIELP